MSTQSLFLFLLVVTRCAHEVFAVRSRARSSSRTIDGASSDVGATASCLYECGARDISVEWEQEDESDGSVQSMSSLFSIGTGSHIMYSPSPEQCLSRCQIVGVNSKQSCSMLYPNSIKVSKNAEYKLCCVPRICNYNPKQNVYEPHVGGDTWWQGIRPYKPLMEINGTTVAARTCLCCDQERAKMKWDSRVKSHCKQAFLVSSAGNAIRGAVRLITIKTSDVIARAHCRSYCSNYPDYPFAMRSRETRSVVAYTVKAPNNADANADAEDDDANTESRET